MSKKSDYREAYESGYRTAIFDGIRHIRELLPFELSGRAVEAFRKRLQRSLADRIKVRLDR